MKLLCVLGLLSLYFAGEQTTAAPEPTPAPGGSLYVLNKDGVNCVLLNVHMNLSITYKKNDGKNATSTFTLPSNTTTEVGGSCKKDGQYMTLTFPPSSKATDKFSVRMNFAENGQKEQYVQDIVVNYVLSDALFPGTNVTGAQVANVSGEFFKVSENNQYLCKSNSTQKINDFVQVMTSELKLQAFRTDNSTAFTGDSQQCPADAETNNIVPIAVGAALAALVVIVLIAYLISRNRNKGGYESV